MEMKVGKTIYKIPIKNNFDNYINKLIEIEQERIISLQKLGLSTEEYLLVHFVRMYILRWAIPVIEIENKGKLTKELVGEIQKRFWLCMYGRALDDIHDKDSKFFTLQDSILILTVYSNLLQLDNNNQWSKEILKQTVVSLNFLDKTTILKSITFDDIKKDVCIRVAYFLSTSEIEKEQSELVNRYIGVLLGKTDLDDCIVDGANGTNATLLSRYLYEKLEDDEGKIHLTQPLINWYQDTLEILKSENLKLQNELRAINANYSISILKDLFVYLKI